MLISPKSKIVYENTYSFFLENITIKSATEFGFFNYYFFPNKKYDYKDGKGNFLILFVNFVNDYRINIPFSMF